MRNNEDRGEFKDNERKSGGRQKNPIDRNTGEILKCNICGSIFHSVRDFSSHRIQCVAMDLKQWSYQDKVWLIHIVDYFTRYSVSWVIQPKRKEVIVESIFETWIAIFGSPKSFLVNNGREFNNSEFISFSVNFNVNIKMTAAESPWSNCLVERNNGVLGNTARKMMSDKPNYSL